MLFATAAVVALAACSKEPRQEQFVGRWKSSRMASGPLLMLGNGEWEIRSADDKVLQYGVWQLKGKRIVWTIKMNGQLQHDVNAIVAVDQSGFQLREADGSITRFDRLSGPPP